MKKRILCFDIDNVICSTKGNNYINSKPKKKTINLINKLHSQGYYIKIFTSRFMGRNKENIKKAYLQGFSFTKKQLKKWNLNYNELIMGKPSYDILIDDKSLGYNKNWKRKIKKCLS